MKSTDQIAAKAAGEYLSSERPLKDVIKAAIEKAHDEGYIQGARAGVLNERESRAAHANDATPATDDTKRLDYVMRHPLDSHRLMSRDAIDAAMRKEKK